MEHATRDESIAKLRELIEGIDTAVLTTTAGDGSLHSRPMATHPLGDEGELWFFTDGDTTKAGDIVVDPEVCVAYSAPDRNRFVSISGRAEIVRDRELMQRLWRPALKSWLPLGLDDPDLALLRVDVVGAQYWDAPSGKLVQLMRAVTMGRGNGRGESGKLPLKTRISSDTAT